MIASIPKLLPMSTRARYTALLILSIILSNCSTVQRTTGGHEFTRDFAWQYRGRSYHVTFDLHPDTYRMFRRRERTRDYDLFASDSHSRQFITEITRKLANHGTASGLSRTEIPHLIVSFVQSLPYTSDDVTTGFDEYPRFPYETLYDNGGDCEDTSILASAMLHKLGYNVALLLFPGHVAVGFECRPKDGQPHYLHQGRRYCYLETTGRNWEIGVMPPSIHGLDATVRPIVERPQLQVEFVANYQQLADVDTVSVDVTVLLKNLGSHTARGVTVYVALRKPGTDMAWDQTRSERFRLDPEETTTYELTGLQVADGNPFQIYVQARGSNSAAVQAVSRVLR